MKNIIKFYYNLVINNFKKINDTYTFDVDGITYSFEPAVDDPNKVYEIYLLIKNIGLDYEQIVTNKDNSFITYFNSMPYILLKKMINGTKSIDFNDIIRYSVPLYKNVKIGWKELWERKIDYYEYQISQFGIKYQLVSNSFSYYIGLCECAIELLNYLSKDDIVGYLSHKRIVYKENYDSFLNPTSITIDSRVRDIAEFFKCNYISDSITDDEFIRNIDGLNLSYNEAILLLARLLYPSYYFDTYDKIIQNQITEDKINVYIEKNASFEASLRKFYYYLRNRYKIPEIEWLN